MRRAVSNPILLPTTTRASAAAMPDKPLTVATYAAGASLAAIALVFAFGPNFLIDGEESGASSRARKKGVVGLTNPANDCFINSILQSLAGLGDLRTYLIRESHRRTLDHELYESIDPRPSGGGDQAKTLGLQRGIVSQALKEVLDGLNERPIYRKTISASRFVLIMENGFKARISRQQQDAQEFLQMVAERLSDEYHAGRRVRERARGKDTKTEEGTSSDAEAPRRPSTEGKRPPPTEDAAEGRQETAPEKQVSVKETDDAAVPEDGFPLEGKLSSQIECQKCHFKPKPRISTFVTLTLHVPHDSSSTTLSHCFDILLKTEYIDDFKCDRCRLLHAHSLYTQKLSRSTATSDPTHAELSQHIATIERTLANDPETPPKDLPLPPLSSAPTSRIARHVSIISFPKIIAIHLSRSMYSAGSASTKNSAKVSFPERLPLGGLLNQRHYKLLGMVTHKGSHNSGHYESFRRQNLYPPFSTPDTFKPSDAYSSRPGTPGTWSPAQSPVISPDKKGTTAARSSTLSAGDVSSSSQNSELVSTPSSSSLNPLAPSPLPTPHKTALTPPTSAGTTTTTASQQAPAPPSTTQPSPQTKPSPSPSTTQSNSSPSPTGARPISDPPSPAPAPLPQDPPSKPPPSKPPINHTRTRTARARPDRWWRISDAKIKEARTQDVLRMQREVYLLFYELDRG